jgi:hypothetical protein
VDLALVDLVFSTVVVHRVPHLQQLPARHNSCPNLGPVTILYKRERNIFLPLF